MSYMVNQVFNLCKSRVVFTMVVVVFVILAVVDLVTIMVVCSGCYSVEEVTNITFGDLVVFMVLLCKPLTFC